MKEALKKAMKVSYSHLQYSMVLLFFGADFWSREIQAPIAVF